MAQPIQNQHLKEFPRTELVYVDNSKLKVLNKEQLKAVYHEHILFLNDIIMSIYQNWRDTEVEKVDIVDIVELLVKKSEELQEKHNKIK